MLFTAKHGTFPSFVHVDAEAFNVFRTDHQLGFEWGWADPKQRFSNYAGFIGDPAGVSVRHPRDGRQHAGYARHQRGDAGEL